MLSLSVFVSADTCTKTDNNGGYVNLYKKGSVKITQNRSITTANDSCFSSSINFSNGTPFWNVYKTFFKNGIILKNETSGNYLMETICSKYLFNGSETYEIAMTYKCPNGCSNGACVSNKSISNKNISNQCDGCNAGGKCLPLGYRKNGKYCNENNTLIIQKLKNDTCENNFECLSNSCINSKCVEEGFWSNIFNWLKRLFGIY